MIIKKIWEHIEYEPKPWDNRRKAVHYYVGWYLFGKIPLYIIHKEVPFRKVG